MPYQFSKSAGVRLFGVPMTEEGIDLEALEQTIRQHRIKMVMVNPSFQKSHWDSDAFEKKRTARESLSNVSSSYF